MEIELKPCPFCGGTDVVCHLDKSGSGYFVLCEGCEAQGPSASSMTGAEFDWSEAVATAAKLAKVRDYLERTNTPTASVAALLAILGDAQ